MPIDRPPIRSGVIQVVDHRIVQVQSDQHSAVASGRTVDLGDVAVLPRLVNAHTHLEFSDCRLPIGNPGIRLSEWIGQVIAARGQASAQQRRERIAAGVAESEAAGVGLIGDIATTPSVYPVRRHSGIVSFAEVLGLSAERGEERLSAAEEHRRSLQGMPAVWRAVSPHAPYSTPERLVGRCVDLARRWDGPVAMHLAESPDERRLLISGDGPFADTLKAGGLWREGLFPTASQRPVADLIELLARSPRALLVHGNDLRQDEIELLSRLLNVSVVYCPRTHAFFGYDRHPVDRLLRAGVRVALGTDSRASNPDLNLWREVQFLLRKRPDLDPHRVLEMATVSGADALLGPGGNRFGRISPGMGVRGTLTSVPTDASTVEQLWRDLAEREIGCMESV
ncbi:amidohydrolase family protein [Roseiconus nitratireducens]|uniref:Amidohydrolase family protein n=1 Tax=Roseiconus nitratireducens TaxID=2605748 RepID=A0A5M6DIM8_9BACT|nr:amidohydrolase family protein [Roseiconus nitratireducens]